MQSEDTIRAGSLAVLRKLSSAGACSAALAAIAHSKQKDGVFLATDLASGTFDLALGHEHGGCLNVIAHEGINMLGGRRTLTGSFSTSIVRPWLHTYFQIFPHFPAQRKIQAPFDVCRQR